MAVADFVGPANTITCAAAMAWERMPQKRQVMKLVLLWIPQAKLLVGRLTDCLV